MGQQTIMSNCYQFIVTHAVKHQSILKLSSAAAGAIVRKT
jgi:hypothetical protein